jgi:hypothetical protein
MLLLLLALLVCACVCVCVWQELNLTDCVREFVVCCWMGQVLSELSVKIRTLLPDDYGQRVRYFISDYQQVADQLRSLIYRTMCPVLIDQASVSNLILLSRVMCCAVLLCLHVHRISAHSCALCLIVV